MKYKTCCARRCMVHGCDTKDNGGCYCLCRLKDREHTLLSLLDGTSYREKGFIIYEPGRIKTPLGGFEKDNATKDLDEVRKRIKEYEINE